MGVSTTTNRAVYSGDGTSVTFSFPYYVFLQTDLVVNLYDLVLGTITSLTLGTHYTVTGTANDQGLYPSGVSVVLSVAPTTTQGLVIYRDGPERQTYSLLNSGTISSTAIVDQLDYLTLLTQRLADKSARAVSVPDGVAVTFNPALPSSAPFDPLYVLQINSAGTGINLISPAALISGASSGVSSIDTQIGALVYTGSGFSARFGGEFDYTSLRDCLAKIINYQYTAPTISLSSDVSTGPWEQGYAITAINFSSSITKKSDPISDVKFYEGATLLQDQTSGGAIPSGGTSTYAWSGSITTTQAFSSVATDNGATGGPTSVTSSRTFSYVYPYYYGAGAAGLSGAAIAALTKLVIGSTATVTEIITVSGSQVFYFAYPATIGNLTSILDVNGFETIGSWTKSTKSITGLDTTSQSYTCYEFQNTPVAGAYQYTFKR